MGLHIESRNPASSASERALACIACSNIYIRVHTYESREHLRQTGFSSVGKLRVFASVAAKGVFQQAITDDQEMLARAQTEAAIRSSLVVAVVTWK